MIEINSSTEIDVIADQLAIPQGCALALRNRILVLKAYWDMNPLESWPKDPVNEMLTWFKDAFGGDYVDCSLFNHGGDYKDMNQRCTYRYHYVAKSAATLIRDRKLGVWLIGKIGKLHERI